MSELSGPSSFPSGSIVSSYQIRQIEEDDLADVITLLSEGFPRRTPSYWLTGLQRLGNRERPPGTEKYGYVLVVDNLSRGVILTIPSLHQDGAEQRLFINISSWYVQRGFRGPPAKELYRRACDHAGITYTNLSPAAHTVETIRSCGFQQWTSGQLVAVGKKWHGSLFQKARILSTTKFRSVDICPSEAKLIADHESFGCLTFLLDTPYQLSSFIFVRRRIRGLIPCAQLIYCRNLIDLVEYGLTISRWLAIRGFPLMLIDACAPIEGLAGHHFLGKGCKYFKGPRPPLGIDHTYSEMVFLGF